MEREVEVPFQGTPFTWPIEADTVGLKPCISDIFVCAEGGG